ncbi:MAG: DUF2088 domain-containing protein, partial [Verrucomicrobia bacterium]|nr:DUF2088 domain-containing protein [Verrucomicrobiota bacterium]
MNLLASPALTGSAVSAAQVTELVAQACPAKDYKGRKVLLIVPDATRTAPVGLIFQTLFRQIGAVTANLDILIALGTHQPMSEAAICDRLEISAAERAATYGTVR